MTDPAVVDAAHEELIAADAVSQVAPFEAIWDQRYASITPRPTPSTSSPAAPCQTAPVGPISNQGKEARRHTWLELPMQMLLGVLQLRCSHQLSEPFKGQAVQR